MSVKEHDIFRRELEKNGLDYHLIERVLESGYFLRTWVNPFQGNTWTTVSDMMYGSKQFSSSFPIEDFVRYVKGEYTFPRLPAIETVRAKSMEEIQGILADPRRTRYIEDGTLSYRGQPRGYTFKRLIPNPVRADAEGREISVTAGIYRQPNEPYSFKISPVEHRTFQQALDFLEPNKREVWLESGSAYDIMRVEQHYATQTAGLDLSYEIETAVYFATQLMKWNKDGRAYYEKVSDGHHKGLIYCFRFTDPPVRQTQFLIREFDLFKTFPPERILRQTCALPLFSEYERNISITDLDSIIELDNNFDYAGPLTPEYMFPSSREDSFYAKLLNLKEEYPDDFTNVVEYQWAR